MLISHKLRFIIIDIPKTGTMSYSATLKPYVDLIGVFKHETDYYSFYQHESSLEAKNKFIKFGWDWENYFKYVTIRNPWSRYSSYYIWVKNKFDSIKHLDIDSIKCLNEKKFALRWKKIFTLYNNNAQKIIQHIVKSNNSQDYYFVSNGDLLVDYVAKTEEINQHFNKLCQTVGINPIPKLKHLHKSQSYNYRDLYDQELIDLVAKKESYVIENYDYQF